MVKVCSTCKYEKLSFGDYPCKECRDKAIIGFLTCYCWTPRPIKLKVTPNGKVEKVD